MGKGGSSVPDDPMQLSDNRLKNALDKLIREERELIRQAQSRVQNTMILLGILASFQSQRIISSTKTAEDFRRVIQELQTKSPDGVQALSVFDWHANGTKTREATFYKKDTVLELTNNLKRWLREQQGIMEINLNPVKAKPIP